MVQFHDKDVAMVQCHDIDNVYGVTMSQDAYTDNVKTWTHGHEIQ